MSQNIILLYKKDKNNFEEMLKNNLVNPKVLMEQNNNGETVLHHLIKSNDNKCVENVLNFVKNNLSRTEKQKFIDTQDENGNTAFHLATQKRAFEIATLLDIYGANKKIPNNNNEIIDVDTEFTDSSDQINCGDRQKINKLVHNIIKPNKNYNNFSEELIPVQQKKNKMLLEKEEEWPKTLDDVNETDNTDRSLSIELENLILSESPKKKSKRENNLTESPKSDLELPESFDDIILTDSSKSKSDSNKKKNFINNFFDNFFSSKQKGGQRDKTSLNLSDKYTSDFNSSSTINLNENMSEFETSTSEFLKYIDNKINQQGGRKIKSSSKSKGKSKSKSKSRNMKSLSSSSSSFSLSDDNRSNSKSSESSFSSDLSSLDSESSFNSKSSDLSSLGSNSSVSDLDMISLSSFGFSKLKGGAKRKQTKKTKKTKGSKKSKYSVSREFSKADELHKEVIKIIQDLGYSEQEARIIKAGLYSYTKDKHPELSNYERSVKMKSYATQQHIANLDINAIKQAIETHFANKKKEIEKKM